MLILNLMMVITIKMMMLVIMAMMIIAITLILILNTDKVHNYNSPIAQKTCHNPQHSIPIRELLR